MSAPAPPRTCTPDDLLTMPDGDRYELVGGRLVERTMSAWSSYVAGIIHHLLLAYCQDHRLGWVLPEGTSYRCFPDDPTRVRRADTSFLTVTRLSPEQLLAEGHLPLAPDLAVEVVSPNDLYYEVDHKVDEWLAAGVHLVWVINPQARRVMVYRADGGRAILPESGELSGEDVLSGFRCRVADLFVLVPGPAPRT